MDSFTLFPEKEIDRDGHISKIFLDRGIHSFKAACEYVHNLPYGFNSDRDDSMILFKEGYAMRMAGGKISSVFQFLELLQLVRWIRYIGDQTGNKRRQLGAANKSRANDQ